MSTETVATPVESNDVDLDTFADELFGQSKAAPETTNSEEEPEDVENRDVTETEAAEEEPQEAETEETDADTAEVEEEEKPKAKPKNRAQERITQLVHERNELAARLAEIEASKQDKPAPAPTKDSEAPAADALNEDGTLKYPLGEFDPKFVRDTAMYTVTEQLKEQRRIEDAAKAEAAAQIEQQALATSWNEKLAPALERYPDFEEKGEELLANLSGLDSAYEDYIAATIMQMDYGPDVLYYLSTNPSEAQTLVNAGPTKAAIMLGRIESKFAMADAEKTLARPKVSKAPSPPPSVKGSSIAKTSVAPDTDDLEAFEKELFRKRKYS